MTKRTSIILCIALALAIAAGFTALAVADSDLPPMPPEDNPQPSGGGGGGGGGGGYSPPVFQPYSNPLKSSDGSVIGSLDGKDFFTVAVSASKNATIDNQSYAVALRSELGNAPDSAVMDILLGGNNSTGLPSGMNDTQVLATAGISRSGRYGWSLKEGSVSLTFTLPETALANRTNASQLYLVRYDGTAYQILPASLGTGSDGMVTLTAAPQSDDGIFTVVLTAPQKPSPTPTPTPTPTATPSPTPTAEPTPGPSSDLFGGYGSMAAALLAGAAVGAVVIFLLTRAFH